MSDIEIVLLDNILQIGQWSVNCVFHAESMMRGGKARIGAWERRTKMTISTDMHFITNTMLSGKRDLAVTKDVLAMAVQNPVPNKVFEHGTATT